MAQVVGRNATIAIWDNTGACQNISGDINNAVLTWTEDNPESTTFGLGTKQRLSGNRDSTFVGTSIWNSGASNIDQTFSGILSASQNTLVNLIIGASSASGGIYSACMQLQSYSITDPLNGAAAASYTFQGSSGSVTIPSQNVATYLLTDYYKLDGLTDATGNGHTLTNNNVVTFVAGKVGNCASFTASSLQTLSLADHADLSTGDIDFTVACWWYENSIAGNNGVFCKGSGGSVEYLLGSFAGFATFYVGGFGTSVQAAGAATSATWHLFVGWHDHVNDKIWLQIDNGTPVSATLVGGPADTTGALLLGEEYSGPTYLDGKLDEWGFWKRVLSPAERTNLWNAGTGKTYPF